jgi:hypothetical protein
VTTGPAERIRVAAGIVMLCPRVRSRGTLVAEALSALFVYVDGISADVSVVSVAVIFVTAVVIRVVIIVVIVGVVVTVAVMISAVVIASVPGGISVVAAAVIHNRSTVPAAVPTAVPPTATPPAHHRAHGDPCTETNNAGGDHITRRVYGGYVSGDNVRRSINNGGVVLRNIHNLWVGGLNHNHLW